MARMKRAMTVGSVGYFDFHKLGAAQRRGMAGSGSGHGRIAG